MFIRCYLELPLPAGRVEQTLLDSHVVVRDGIKSLLEATDALVLCGVRLHARDL